MTPDCPCGPFLNPKLLSSAFEGVLTLPFTVFLLPLYLPLISRNSESRVAVRILEAAACSPENWLLLSFALERKKAEARSHSPQLGDSETQRAAQDQSEPGHPAGRGRSSPYPQARIKSSLAVLPATQTWLFHPTEPAQTTWNPCRGLAEKLPVRTNSPPLSLH